MKNKSLIQLLSIFALMLLMATTNIFSQTPDLCNSRPCIHIGSYNIEWLGTTDTSKHEHRSRTAVRRIAQLISDTADLEVVVLEEINSESQEYTWLKEALEEKGYKLKAGTTGGEQRVVIAYDDDEVDLLGDESGQGIKELDVRSNFNLSNNCRSNGLRLPMMGHFKAGNFDFLLIGVHLKAQPGGQCSDRVRREQAKDIRDKIPQLISAANERDVIIAGDFNAALNDTSLNPLLVDAGFASLMSPNRLSNVSYDVSYLEAPFREVIDHLMVKLSDTNEWINRSGHIFSPPTDTTLLRNYLKFNSDHVPVWASFITDAPSD